MNLIERLKGAIDGFQGKSAAPNLYPVRAHEKQTGLMDYTGSLGGTGHVPGVPR
jgi:hypothetical protein